MPGGVKATLKGTTILLSAVTDNLRFVETANISSEAARLIVVDARQKLAKQLERLSDAWGLGSMASLFTDSEERSAEAFQLLLDAGYRVALRSSNIDYPPGLAERMSKFEGKYIVYDPNDDCDGFCVVGDDLVCLVKQAATSLELGE